MTTLSEPIVRLMSAAHDRFREVDTESPEIEAVLTTVEAVAPHIIAEAVSAKKIEALLIPADEKLAVTLVRIAPTLAGIHEHTGGGPNSIPWDLNGHAVTAQLRDTDREDNIPVNRRAVHLGLITNSISEDDAFVGDVLLTGRQSGIMDATDLVGFELNWATNEIALMEEFNHDD